MFNIDFDYEDFFVKRLQQLRDQKNISAREMSVSLGQNINYINQIENKKNFPTMQSFFYICQYLNITPEEFFCIDKVNPEKSEDVYKRQVMRSVHFSYAQTASQTFNAIFDNRRVFENPKSIDDIKKLVEYVTVKDDCDIILDLSLIHIYFLGRKDIKQNPYFL